MNWETSKKLVIAHRGDTENHIENTLPAFESAIKIGVDGIELDLQLTRDGEIVVFHDRDLKRLAGTEHIIEKTNLADLRKISVGNTFIPTLTELLDLVQNKVLLNLEIKTTHYGNFLMESRLVETLKKFNLQESILVSSFHPLSLSRLRFMAPELSRGYLFENRYRLHRLLIPWIDPFSINAPLTYVSPDFVDIQHERGYRVFVWTVNHDNDIKKCISCGVDGIITDKPKKVLTFIHGQQRGHIRDDS